MLFLYFLCLDHMFSKENHMLQRLFHYCCVILLVLLTGCSVGDAPEKPRELLIYCGVTMIKPMEALGKIFEKQEGCKVVITKGGSGSLFRAIKVNKVGDLYLPGCRTYVTMCEKEGLVSESVRVGSNRAVMMVAKGNPKHIPADLMALASPAYYVVLGNPCSGSIGRETKNILLRRGILDAVLDNVKDLTPDSKDLVKVLREDTADVVINWYATATWPDNSPYVEALPIDPTFAPEKELVLGLLSTSLQPELARKFLTLAASEKGRAIFQRFGLYSEPS